MRRNRIQEQWGSYRREVLPADAPAIQVQECRRAFYAGAQGLMAIMLKGLEPDAEPTEADLKMMNEIEAELRDFLASVKAGRA